MAREQIAVAEMIVNMILGKTENVNRVDFFPQKGKFPEFVTADEQPFERATPESQGIASSRLARMLTELYTSKDTDMHHLMAVRHGKVICECSFAPYRNGMWHITHSMCKSITGMAVGMLIGEGKLSLDENIYEIFSDKLNRNTLLGPLAKMIRPVVTVENLLTMTSGITFNESGVVSGNDWLGSYLNAPAAKKPGTEFQYNSMNTYVLSAIVTERTGQTMEEYLRPRLFEPMGIRRYLWETCPKGSPRAAGDYFCARRIWRSWAGSICRRETGRGSRLVPEEWVEASTAKHMDTGENTYGYGYQLWMERRPGSFEFNGMLGQNVIVYPDMDMVIVTNAGNNELFQDSTMLNIIRKYFPEDYHPAECLPENPQESRMLREVMGRLEKVGMEQPVIRGGGWGRRRRAGAGRGRDSWMETAVVGRSSIPGISGRERDSMPGISGVGNGSRTGSAGNPANGTEFMHRLDGKRYVLKPQSVGLYPLFIQVFHNNMTEGIRRVEFLYKQGAFYVCFQEGEEWYPIRVGFSRAEEMWLTMREESYLVGTKGTFARDENGDPVLKLEMAYLEEAVKRRVHIFFREGGEKIELRWFEAPGKELILEGLEAVTEELSGNVLFYAIKDKGGMDLIHRLMEQTIEPVAFGTEEKVSADVDFLYTERYNDK